jgi:hypothetical protein
MLLGYHQELLVKIIRRRRVFGHEAVLRWRMILSITFGSSMKAITRIWLPQEGLSSQQMFTINSES